MNAKHHSMKVLNLTIVFFLTLSLIACSKQVWIKLVGNVDSQVEFFFYKDSEKKELANLNVDQLVVQGKTSNDRWDIVWHVEGDELLSSIVYGDDYSGLSVVKKAEKLERGKSYRVLLDASEVSGGLLFYVDGEGNVQPELSNDVTM